LPYDYNKIVVIIRKNLRRTREGNVSETIINVIIAILCHHVWWFLRRHLLRSGVPRSFIRGVQHIQLRTEDRKNGDLGAVSPYSGVLEAAVIWYKKFHFI
jgi:hypothetical protein